MPSGQQSYRNLKCLWLLILLVWVLPLWPQTYDAGLELTSAHRVAQAQEDWTSLALPAEGLPASKPIVGEQDQEPTYTREIIRVQWRIGDPVDLYVIKPKAIIKPPVVLFLYSYPSETERFRDNGYCQRITNGGNAAVGFVSALTGNRYKDRPMKEWFVSELPEAIGTSVHDVQMVLNYLATREDLDMNKVAMFGEGSGGTIAILSAAVDSRIKAIDVLDPWGDWPEWMAHSSLVPEDERPRYLTSQFLSKVAPVDPVLWFPRLKTQKIRIDHVLDDSITSKAAKDRIEAAAPGSAQIVRYETTRQFFTQVHGGHVFDWVKDQVGADAKSPAGSQHGDSVRTRSEARPLESGNN